LPTDPGLRRVVEVPPVDLRRTLTPVRRHGSDPTTRLDLTGFWRATRTPEGPATLRITVAPGRSVEQVRAEAWGPGAAAAIETVPGLVGAADDPGALQPQDDLVARLVARSPGLRLPATGSLVEVLVPVVLEQKVTGKEAQRSWWSLCRRYGEPAPGPVRGLWCAPRPEDLAGLAYHHLHPLGVERKRAEALLWVCRAAARIERLARTDPATARRGLQELPGIGPWSAAWATLVAFGDPDAVIVGDYHLPHLVAHSYTGRRRSSDAEMLALLEPHRGQRARVQRLVVLGGRHPERRGPRLAPREFARS